MWIILIILALILIIAGLAVRPEIGLYLMAFFLPVLGWSFYIQGLDIPFIDGLALLVLLSFALRFIFFALFAPGRKITLKWPLFLPFLVFLLINFLSALLSDDVLYSIKYLVRWPLFLYFAYIFLPYNLLISGKILKKTIIALVASTLLVLMSGYLSLYGQDWQESFFRLQTLSWWGIYPFGDNHNLIAEFLNVGAFLILAFKALTKNVQAKRWLDVAFVLTALGIILTFSRAAWITLFLQIIIYIAYHLWQKKQQTAHIVFATIILLLIMSPLAWKMTQLQKDNISSTEDRWLLTEISLKTLDNRPYLGYGSGEFINLVGENVRFRAKYGEPIDSHGFLQKILAENGLFGLAAWLFLIIYLVKTSYRALQDYQARNPWLLPLVIAGGGGLFYQLFNTSYYKGKVWLPIVLTLAAIRLLEAKHESKK